jgi:5-methylcytosine-specific restriction endonuclease McrA
MKTKPYIELLRDPRWQKKRLEIMQRDNFTCQLCGDTESPLNVHHKYYMYDKTPWEYPSNLLITLCEHCHKIEESNKYIVLDFTKVLLSDGYSCRDLITLLDLLRKIPANEMDFSFIRTAVKEYQEFLLRITKM